MTHHLNSSAIRLLIAGWTIFAGSIANAANHPPVIFWASDPVAPGETVLVTGSGFGDQPKVEMVRLPDGKPTQPVEGDVNWSGAVTTSVSQPADQSLKFTIPDTLQPGVFAYRIITPSGKASGFLNRPLVYWLQGNLGPSASPGGWLRVFGRNLLFSPLNVGKGIVPKLLLRGPRTLLLDLDTGNPWSVNANLPKDLPTGDYEACVQNDAGGDLAWSAPLKLHIETKEEWPKTIYNVRDFGADGLGLHDDTAAIQAALDKAGTAGGGVVLLPRGRYQATTTLTVPRFVKLRGDSIDASCLFWPDSATPPDAMIRGINHFAIHDLTIYAGNHRHIIVGDAGDKPDSGHVSISSVRIRADDFRTHLTADEVNQRFVESQKMNGGGDSIRLGGSGIEITYCDIYGSGRSLYLSQVRGGYVSDNHLYNGRWGWYCISGSDGLIFQRNKIQGADLMSTGGGLNTLDGSRSSQNVFYADNEVSLMNGWDRESMTSDGGGGPFSGHITACDGVNLTLAGTPDWKGDWAGAAVCVLKGHGAGQVRRVAKTNGSGVTLDLPFDEPLDATSELAITQYQGHYLLIGNHFSDCGPVQFYGTAIENVVAGNTGERMQGFIALALNYYGVQPCLRCQYLGNKLSGSYYHWTRAADSILQLKGNELGWNQGCVLRNNILEDNATIQIESVSDALVEGSRVTDSDVGIFVSKSSERVLVRGNQFARVTHEMQDEAAQEMDLRDRLKKFADRPDPVAYYDFGSLANGQFADKSGNGLAATIEGGVKPDPSGHVGGAVSFDGTGYLQVDDLAIFDSPDITIDFWMKPATVSGRRGLIAKRFDNGDSPLVISQVGNAITFEAESPDGHWHLNFAGPPMLAVGQWTRVTVVVKENEGVKIYANGKLVAQKDDLSTRLANDAPLIIGREAWGGDPPATSTPGFFVGDVDELKIWTRALSADEVAKNGR